VALSLQCNFRDKRVVTSDRVEREVRVRSGAGSWPGRSRSRVVRRGAESPFPGPGLDMTCLNLGRAEISSPVLTGPVPVPGIVLFLGAAIPGIPAWGGQPGTKRLHSLEGGKTHDEFPGGSDSSEGGTDRTAHLPTA
jgi:hypothetical protein